MRGILIACHGDLADGLKGAAEKILGPLQGVQAISNSGYSPEALKAEISKWLERQDDHPVILVDFPGSSCFRAALLAVRDHDQQVTVVAGVNLGMLLGYLNKREHLEPAQIPETLLADGQRCLKHWVERENR